MAMKRIEANGTSPAYAQRGSGAVGQQGAPAQSHQEAWPREVQPPPAPRRVPPGFRYQASFLLPMGIGFTVMSIAAGVLWYFELGVPLLAVVAAVLVGPACLIIALWFRARVRRLYREGEVVVGRVSKHVRGDMSAARSNTHVYVDYAAGGGRWQGAFLVSSSFSPPPLGTPVWVIYDRANPARNLIAGKNSF
jgi:hypothetical protein